VHDLEMQAEAGTVK